MDSAIRFLRRPFLFLFAFICALILVGVSVGVYVDEGVAAVMKVMSIIFVGFPLWVLVLPVGLTAFLFPEVEIRQLFILGYIPYLVLFVLGNVVRNRRVFIVIYLGFIALLLMNVVGCVHIITGFLDTVE